MIEYLKNLEYTIGSEISIDDSLISTSFINLDYPDKSIRVVVPKINEVLYCTLMCEDFIFSYNGTTTRLTDFITDEVLDSFDINITEEWFFQTSCKKNYSTLEYRDVCFVREFYNHLFGEPPNE